MILKNAVIYTPNKVIDQGWIEIEDSVITSIGEGTVNDGIDMLGRTIIPGFIDIHTHGISGVDTMNATKSSIIKFAASLPEEGVTGFLPTTITQETKKLVEVVSVVDEVMNAKYEGAEILGIHLEGPFINKKYKGAQPEQFIQDENIEEFEELLNASNNKIKVATIGVGGNNCEFVKYLSDANVIPSVGHSDATYEEVERATKYGLKHATHTYNGMKGIHHRDVGVVGATMLLDELTAEIICDGVHVSPPAVKLLYKIKGSKNIILITDSMEAKGLSDGEYELGGQKVILKDGEVRLSSGVLAGSVLRMIDAFKNVISFTGCTLEEAISMSSTNAARSLGILDRKGTIEIGKDADLVILDENLEIFHTICMGKMCYSKEMK